MKKRNGIAFALLLAGAALAAQERTEQGEVVMKVLAASYPGVVGAAEQRDGDWAVPVRDAVSGGEVWFYYAHGRLLPENLRASWEEYAAQPFYAYPEELPPWQPPDKERAASLRAWTERRRENPPKRANDFFDALYRTHSRAESWSRQQLFLFLGKYRVTVHYSILEDLALVEERILEAAKTDRAVRAWINGIKSVSGWSWRDIAGTESRSFHAYGAAIDIIPKSYGGLASYWQWVTGEDWWMVPYSRRFHPPAAVIKAFEAQGFIWGGKWFQYDTMHFEYRPDMPAFTRAVKVPGKE